MVNTEVVWQEVRAKLKNFIQSKVSDSAVVDDILQEVFIKMHLKIDTLKDDTKLQSWLYQITRNLIMDHFRAQTRQRQPVPEENDAVDDAADTAVMEEALQDMTKMMDHLPAHYCEVLCQVELGRLSLKEYAEQEGISYTAAKTRVQRSRKMLKDMLMRCCHYEFDTYGTVFNIEPHDCCCCTPGK